MSKLRPAELREVWDEYYLQTPSGQQKESSRILQRHDQNIQNLIKEFQPKIHHNLVFTDKEFSKASLYNGLIFATKLPQEELENREEWSLSYSDSLKASKILLPETVEFDHPRYFARGISYVNEEKAIEDDPESYKNESLKYLADKLCDILVSGLQNRKQLKKYLFANPAPQTQTDFKPPF